MEPELFITGDGSHSVLIPGTNISYHSRHGAIQESRHIFIEAGLIPLLQDKSSLAVFEIGMGTGLNVLLSYIITEGRHVDMWYEALEQYPLRNEIFSSINYCSVLGRPDLQQLFNLIHQNEWQQVTALSNSFHLFKRQEDIRELSFTRKYDLVYFDAFSPEVSPEIWTLPVFQKIYDALKPSGTLLTYCSKTVIRRVMEQAGFTVEKIPGPYGKREIVRAQKI